MKEKKRYLASSSGEGAELLLARYICRYNYLLAVKRKMCPVISDNFTDNLIRSFRILAWCLNHYYMFLTELVYNY